MDNLLNESADNTFLQINDLNNKNEHYLSSHKFNLFQQFFIIGLDPKVLYNINDIDILSLPPTFLEPKIISKYPNTLLPYLSIPDFIIASHCFPNGLKNRIINAEQKELLKDETFIFSIENQGYEEKESSLRTKRVYYTCYFFYESIEDYRKCINLKKNNKNKNNELNKNYYIPKVICLSSFLPLHKDATLILKSLKHYVENYSYIDCCLSKKKEFNKNLFPIEKIIESLILNIPGLPRAKYTLKINNETLGINKDEYKKLKNNKHIKEEAVTPQEISINVSPINKLPLPLIDFSQLMYFFQIEDIFEIIKWIILEIPILFFCENIKDLTYIIEGLLSLLYPFDYPYPVIAILPEKNYPLISIMKHFIFGINYKYSKEIFNQKGINIQNQNLLIVVKIEKKYNEILNFKEKEKINNSPILILKSDKSRPILKLDQLYSYYNDNNQQELKKIEQSNMKKQKMTLPMHQKERLKKKFIENVDLKVKELCSNLKKKQLSEREYNKIISENLTETIFNFFVAILLHYQEFCYKLVKKKNKEEKKEKENTDNNTFYNLYEKDDTIEKKYNENKIDINDIFNIKDFLNTIPQVDKNFYSHFLSTKLFYNFMMKKIFPISVTDKLEVLFFDEKINEKQAKDSGNKKFVSLFLKDELANMKEDINLYSFRKQITQDFVKFLLSPRNQYKALNYFQYITKVANTKVIKEEDDDDMNNEEEELNDVSFNYFVFPKLLNDDAFYREDSTIEKFLTPERNAFTSSNSNCIYNQFDKQGQLLINNADMVKKYNDYNYSLNLVSTFNVKMKDNIYLLWLQYFAKTFHYIPLSERKLYYNQMMNILKNIQNVDQNTYNILFWTINKYGDRNMNQDFFINLKNKEYITFLALREKMKQKNNFIRYNDNIELLEEEKNETLSNKNMILFDESSNCENQSCNEPYNVQKKILLNESINTKDNFIKFKCEKCKTEQNIWVKCIYDNGLGKGINIKFRLISPLALLNEKWFQDQLDLDLYHISREHNESYMSAMFYFYLQGIFCSFMIPPKKNNHILKIEQNISYNLSKDNQINNNIIINQKNEVENKINDNEKKSGKNEKIKVIFSNKAKNEKKVVIKKDNDKSLGKSVSQNYFKTINVQNSKNTDKNTIFNKYVTIGKSIKGKEVKEINNTVNLSGEGVDLNISGENKGLFEYRTNFVKKKNPYQKKAQVISLKNKMMNSKGILKNNKSCLQLNPQSSYDYFQTNKKKKDKKDK